MSYLNPLELEKWVPRRPSPKIYERLFHRDRESDMAFHLRDLSRWIIPAFGCFLLVMGSLSNHLPAHFEDKHFVLPPLTEEMSVAILPGVKNHSGVNCYPAKSYEWSVANRSFAAPAAFSPGSLLISLTNKLIQ